MTWHFVVVFLVCLLLLSRFAMLKGTPTSKVYIIFGELLDYYMEYQINSFLLRHARKMCVCAHTLGTHIHNKAGDTNVQRV